VEKLDEKKFEKKRKGKKVGDWRLQLKKGAKPDPKGPKKGLKVNKGDKRKSREHEEKKMLKKHSSKGKGG